jgi:Gpi18-like mannosyltransferase
MVKEGLKSKSRFTIYYLLFTVLFWRLWLFLAAYLGTRNIALRKGFLGPIPWANMDGIHYLTIAEYGYGAFQQAFFPLHPLLIRLLTPIFRSYLFSALFISHVSFLMALFLFIKLLSLDSKAKLCPMPYTLYSLLFFPTSFFFASVYTESLFLTLVLGSFYFARRKKWFVVSTLGAFASATRLVGVLLLPALVIEFWQQNKSKIKDVKRKIHYSLLLIPLGLFSYMFYLNKHYGDPFLFSHVQPAFGAQRSGGELVLLPQVIWRYFKIFITADLTFQYGIAVLEFLSLTFAGLMLIFAFFKKMRLSYQIFAWSSLLAPTLTGTLSSLPRYILTIFPIFIALGLIESKKVKIFLLFVFSFLLFLLTSFFTRGYFIA